MSDKRFTGVAETPREELECEKKYLYEHSMFWECNDGSKCQILEDDVVRLLNEKQSIIKYLTIEKHQADKRFQTIIAEINKDNEQLRKELKEIKENPINYF